MFKKYPFVKQEGFKDCGSACLLMIIKYYKGNLTIERLRDLTRTNKGGTNAYNIIKASEQIGFNSCGMKGKITDLKSVIVPFIAHVIIDNNLKHFIVVYEINFDKEYLIIADPSSRIKKVSFSYFNSIWTGNIISLYPIRSIPFVKSVKPFEFIFKNICKYKKTLYVLFLISVATIVLKLLSSFYFKFIIEGIDSSKVYLNNIFIIFLLLSITRLIINYLRGKFLVILNCRLDFSLVLDSFKRVVSLPYQYYHNRTTGEIISKINDLSVSRDFISRICVGLFIDFPLVIISAIFLIRINFYLFLISLFILFCYIVISFMYRRVFNLYISEVKNNHEITNSYMYEAINGFETVKGISIESSIINRFNDKYVRFLNNIYKLNNHVNNQNFIKDFIGDIGNLFIMFVGSLLVFDNKLDIGYLVTYSSMMVYFMEPIRNIVDMDINIKESFESITRVLSLYESFNDKGIVNFKEGNICFKNLSFNFDGCKNILSGVNLCINKGDKVMLYGPSGCGKSTLLKLLMGYYSISRGMLFIDGIDINDYKLKSLRKNISYISQNEVLFNDTILNNLNFYTRDNNDILDMASLVRFDELLNNELGLNMMIEENGFNISGGQRQRIVLARTLLKQAQIILIDEGLNQIDVSLERKILLNIFEKFNDKTFIIISHRMENTDLFNRIISIDKGCVYEK